MHLCDFAQICYTEHFHYSDQRSHQLYASELAGLQLGSEYNDIDAKINCGDQ